jgi:hypothetical protein
MQLRYTQVQSLELNSHVILILEIFVANDVGNDDTMGSVEFILE